MPALCASLNLYPKILGEAWDELAAAVRSAHMVSDEKRGRFRVTHGGSRIARWLIRLSRLPRNSDNAEVLLKIHQNRDQEHWERHFGSDRFHTVQRASNGYLLERVDIWELQFALRVSHGALVYEQCGARLCIGPLRLPVPLAFAPRVQAIEEACGSDQVHVRVSVALPCVGPLISYDGHLDVGGIVS